MASDFTSKEQQLRQWMANQGHTCLLLTSQTNFAWLTGGRGHILTASEGACAAILLTPDATCLLTSNIEARRLYEEELAGLPVAVHQSWWYEPAGILTAAQALCGGTVPPSDLDPAVESALSPLRWTLSPGDQAHYRDGARRTAAALEAACRQVAAGRTEFELAALVAAESHRRDVDPILILAATDDRVFRHRHPLPTERRLERYAMLVLCGRYRGLIASCTRLVHIGSPSSELRRRHLAAATVDAAMIAATRPGATAGDIFTTAREAYAAAGFPDEWQLHHQGGLAGFKSREYVATPDASQMVAAGQAFAWNPSVTGAKSEDTILVTDQGFELLTHTGSFPMVAVSVKGRVIARPDFLVL